jgi:hypothetical protein
MGSPAVAEMCVLVGGACIDNNCAKESTPSYYCEVADCACYDDTAWCGDDDYIASLVYGVLTLSGGGQQPWYAAGNIYTITASDPTVTEVTYQNGWGDGDDVITASSYTATIQMLGASGGNSVAFQVTSFTMSLPSFSSAALGGGQTGINSFTLSNLGESVGTLDVSTGQISVAIRTRLTNSYLSATEPALVKLDLAGTLNPSTMQLQAGLTATAWDYVSD